MLIQIGLEMLVEDRKTDLGSSSILACEAYVTFEISDTKTLVLLIVLVLFHCV